MDHHVKYLEGLVNKGGPSVEDFHDFNIWTAAIAEQARNGNLSPENLMRLREVLGEAISVETMQGFVLQKPHGYAGDYEFIDRIYTRYVSDKTHLSKWDVYMQGLASAYAVRNRIEYLRQQLDSKIKELRASRSMEVLNLASGPGRDMLKFFEIHPEARVHFDCIERDQNAVNHAKELCVDFLHKITFHVKNALRLKSKKKYDFIWSAGLFNYVNDKVFIHVLKNLGSMIAEGGEIVVGNFSTLNPNIPYLEFFEWNLHHRSPQNLTRLAVAAGFSAEQVRVEKEPTGVNLFLHIKQGGICAGT
jgi:extracellular factor (EF) 3-hydroxypalmitic acid methyl ester biosynthesis protein